MEKYKVILDNQHVWAKIFNETKAERILSKNRDEKIRAKEAKNLLKTK